MHVAGGDHGFPELFPELHHPLVQRDQIFLGVDIPQSLRFDHKPVVADRLDLQIVIKLHNAGDLFVALSVEHGTKQLPRLAGAAQDQTFPVLLDQTLWDQWSLVKIFQMGLGYQLVEVDAPRLVLCQYDNVVGMKLPDRIDARLSQLIERFQGIYVILFQHLDKFQEDLRRALRVIDRPVMVLE